ncbi:hypothetical protein EBZ39_15525 [bacterium]|nr:hypothetical protein [bacterium]
MKLLHTAWAGVQIALEALRGIQARVLEALASGTGTVLQGAALAARAFGRDGLTASIEGAAQEAEQSKTIFASMGAESSRKILEIDRAAKETRRTIDEGAVSISKALGQIVPNAAKLAAASIQRIGGVDWSKVLGQPDEAIKRYRQIEDALAARQIARENALVSQRIQLDATETTRAIRAATAREGAVLAIRAQMEEEAANDGSSAEARRLAARTLAARGEIVSIRAVAAEAATIDEKIANIRGALGQVTQGLGQAIVRGGDVGQVVISNLQSLAGNVIQLLIDKLAELAAASIFKGILNIFTGGIGGAIGGIFGFASGGIVPSTAGIPGVDSVPALLTPGERVLSVRETRALASGALTAGGGGNVTINVDTRGSVLPESPADLERRVRPIEAAGRRAARATGGRRS